MYTVRMANASCCICVPRLPSSQTQGLQMGQLRVAAQVGDASSVSRAPWELLHCMPSIPPVMLQSAISALVAPKPLCASSVIVFAQMMSEPTGLCLLQAAQAQAHGAEAFHTVAAGR